MKTRILLTIIAAAAMPVLMAAEGSAKKEEAAKKEMKKEEATAKKDDAKKEETAKKDDAKKEEGEKKMQQTCPVMGGKINKKLYVDHDGKRIYVCCKACIAKVKKDPETYVKKIEAKGEAIEAAPEATAKSTPEPGGEQK